MTAETFEIHAIGRIRQLEDQAKIEIHPQFEAALLGLTQFSHIWVLYWFHENDTPDQRRTLQVHPRGNPDNPLTGVFATHSPVRPNLIALTRCRLLAVQGRTLTVDGLDARDRSPVIDIKSYFPPDIEGETVRTPSWAGPLTSS